MGQSREENLALECEYLARLSDDLTRSPACSQYLQDETFQVSRFRHGGEDGMVAGLPALFQQANLPFRVPCGKTDTRPQFLFGHMMRTGACDQKPFWLGKPYSKMVHIFVSD
jgi:hypothetical protein